MCYICCGRSNPFKWQREPLYEAKIRICKGESFTSETMNAVALNGQKRTLKNENIFIRKLVNEKLKIPPTKPFTILNFKNLGRTSLNYIKFEIEFIQRILRLSYCERFRRDVSFKRKAVFTIYLTWLAEDNYYCGLFSLIYIFHLFQLLFILSTR